jgi:2-C-methyl-D-erythritol 4-phosphate cytidylyltransferase
VSLIGIVPVAVGDPSGRAAALRELAGISLLARAVLALAGSGRVTAVLVVAQGPPEPVLRVLPDRPIGGDVPVRVVGALDAAPDRVVVHDPLHGLVSPGLVREVVDALDAAGDDVLGAVAVRPVTDTLKWVDADDIVRGTADRSLRRVICTPQAYRGVGARVAVEALWTPDDLPGYVAARGAVRAVEAPYWGLGLADPADLEVAHALLDVVGDPLGTPRTG